MRVNSLQLTEVHVSSMPHRTGARPWRSLLCVAALLAAMLLAAGAGSAAADCTTGGSSCLPTTGYSTDDTWSCGVIDELDNCYFDSTKNSGLATPRSWGWGSASYSGAGSTWVCINGGSYFFACSTNLARACFRATCSDQSTASFLEWVENFTGAHTVYGHGMA